MGQLPCRRWRRAVACSSFASIAAAAAAVQERASTPSPISVAPANHFEGVDGQWTTFAINLGTPAQIVNLLVSTAAWQTLAVVPEGCPSSLPADCPQDRGGLYSSNQSSTWASIGEYYLGIEQNLGLNDPASFGNETIGLEDNNGGVVTLTNQVVGEIDELDLYLGLLGINPQPSRFSVFGDGQPSLITSLKEQNLIPSSAFGYTAGASYRMKQGALGSLTLGGYDASRFTPNNVIFDFASDENRNLVVGIESIQTSANGKGTPLLPSGVQMYIDSTESEIWLPVEACQLFEKAFNLTWDPYFEIYTTTSEQQSALVTANPNITFTMSDLAGGPSFEIVLPYQAFALEASYPRYGNFTNSSTPYFPLRQAANDTQYTIGRVFLQESYLTVNWENSTFSLSQCVFPEEGFSANIIPIGASSNSSAPPGTTPSSNPSAGGSPSSSSSSTSTNSAAIGAGVGVPVGLALVGLLAFCLWRRKKSKQRQRDSAATGYTDEKVPRQFNPLNPSSWPLLTSGASFRQSRQSAAAAAAGPKRELGTDLDHEIYEAENNLSPSDAGFVGGGARPKHTPLPVAYEVEGQDSHMQELESPPLEDEIPAELAAGYGGHELLGSPPTSAFTSRRETREISPTQSSVVSPVWGGGVERGMSSRRAVPGAPSPMTAVDDSPQGLNFVPVASSARRMPSTEESPSLSHNSNNNNNIDSRGGRPGMVRNQSSISDMVSLPSPRTSPLTRPEH